MTATKPPEGRCLRCKQTRPLFAYRPIHDCITEIGPVSITEAANYIAGFDDDGDRWCEARVERRHNLRTLCVPCCDREAKDEQEFIDTVLEARF
jgi:hypothetical protein